MGYVRLWRHDLTIQRAYGGTDSRLVPAPSATVEVYRQGATVKTEATLVSGDTAITVQDPNGITEFDTLQVGTDSGNTMLVRSVGLNTITVYNFTPGTLPVGTRLVVKAVRPSVYTDQAGLSQVSAGNQGLAPSTGSTTGATSFYTACPVIDVIVSGGGLSAAQLMTDISGQMQNKVLDIESFGGYESSVKTGISDLGNFNNQDVLLAGLTTVNAQGGGTLTLGPGTYYIDGAVTWTNLQKVKIKGAGMRRTTLYLNTASGTLFTFPASSAQCGVEDLTFQRSEGTGPVVQVSAGCADTTFRRVRYYNAGAGILDNGTATVSEDCVWEGEPVKCIEIADGYGQRYIRPRFRCASTNLSTNALVDLGDAAGIPFDVYFEDFYNEWSGTNKGTALNVRLDCRRITFMGGTFTGGIGSGGIDGANAIAIADGKGVTFICPHIHSSLNGISVTGGKGIQVVAPQIVSCQQKSIDVASGIGHTVDVLFPFVSDSNTANAAVPHIGVSASSENWRIIGPRCGNYEAGPITGGIATTWGVDVAAGSGTGGVLALAAGRGGSGVWRMLNASKYLTVGLNQAETTNTGGKQTGLAFISRTQTDNSATPDVEGISFLKLNYTGVVAVTDLINSSEGQIVIIKNISANNVTIADGGNFATVTPSATITLSQNETAMFFDDGTIWKQITIAEI